MPQSILWVRIIWFLWVVQNATRIWKSRCGKNTSCVLDQSFTMTAWERKRLVSPYFPIGMFYNGLLCFDVEFMDRQSILLPKRWQPGWENAYLLCRRSRIWFPPGGLHHWVIFDSCAVRLSNIIWCFCCGLSILWWSLHVIEGSYKSSDICQVPNAHWYSLGL